MRLFRTIIDKKNSRAEREREMIRNGETKKDVKVSLYADDLEKEKEREREIT